MIDDEFSPELTWRYPNSLCLCHFWNFNFNKIDTIHIFKKFVWLDMYLKVHNCLLFFIEKWLNTRGWCQAIILFLFGQLRLIWYICEPNWSDIHSLKHLHVFQRVCRFSSFKYGFPHLSILKRLGLSLAFCNTCIKPQDCNTACMSLCCWDVMRQMFGSFLEENEVPCSL